MQHDQLTGAEQLMEKGQVRVHGKHAVQFMHGVWAARTGHVVDQRAPQRLERRFCIRGHQREAIHPSSQKDSDQTLVRPGVRKRHGREAI